MDTFFLVEIRAVDPFIHPSNFKRYPILFVNEVSQFYDAEVVTVVCNVVRRTHTYNSEKRHSLAHAYAHSNTKSLLDEFPAFAYIAYVVEITWVVGTEYRTICVHKLTTLLLRCEILCSRFYDITKINITVIIVNAYTAYTCSTAG